MLDKALYAPLKQEPRSAFLLLAETTQYIIDTDLKICMTASGWSKLKNRQRQDANAHSGQEGARQRHRRSV